MGVSQDSGYPLRGPHIKGSSTSGSMLGCPDLRNLPHDIKLFPLESVSSLHPLNSLFVFSVPFHITSLLTSLSNLSRVQCALLTFKGSTRQYGLVFTV